MNEATLPEEFSIQELRGILVAAGKGERTIRVLDPQGEIVCYAISTAGRQVAVDDLVRRYIRVDKNGYSTRDVQTLNTIRRLLEILGAEEALAELPAVH